MSSTIDLREDLNRLAEGIDGAGQMRDFADVFLAGLVDRAIEFEIFGRTVQPV